MTPVTLPHPLAAGLGLRASCAYTRAEQRRDHFLITHPPRPPGLQVLGLVSDWSHPTSWPCFPHLPGRAAGWTSFSPSPLYP